MVIFHCYVSSPEGIYIVIHILLGGLEHDFYDFPIILGISSSQLTLTPSFFQRGRYTSIPPTSNTYIYIYHIYNIHIVYIYIHSIYIYIHIHIVYIYIDPRCCRCCLMWNLRKVGQEDQRSSSDGTRFGVLHRLGGRVAEPWGGPQKGELRSLCERRNHRFLEILL